MPEPTNHRAQAEFWVNQFHDRIGPVNPEPRDMLLLAHIHALLALHRRDEQRQDSHAWDTPGPALTTASTPVTPTESQRCDAQHLGLRCVFWAGHKDPHRGWTGE